MTSPNNAASQPLEYTFWPTITATTGQRRSATLEQLAELHTSTVRPSKKNLPLIDLALYPGDSRAMDVKPEAWTGTVLDYDDGTPIESVSKVLQQLNLLALIHETASSTQDKPRFHVFLPYRKPVSDELKRRRVLNWLAEKLPKFSRETVDSKRPWFIGHLPGVSIVTIFHGFTVDLLARIPASLGGFNREASRQRVLDAGDGSYAYLRSLAMHLANTDCDVEEELRKEDDAYFDGHCFAAHERDLLRAIRGASRKADKQRAPTVDPPEIDTPPASNAFELYSAADLAKLKPHAPEFTLDGWLPKNGVTLLAGHGGTGKSYIALNLALHLSQGKPVLGSTPKKQRVLYLHCEDPRSVVHWRMSRYSIGYPEDLLLIDGTKTDNRLFLQTPNGFTAPTALYMQLKELCNEGVDVLILDGSADVFGGNENDRGQVKAFVNLLAALAPTVLLLAHTNRVMAQQESTGHDYSGSTGWHNAVRSRLALHTLSGKVLFEVQKSNWSASGLCCQMAWNDDRKVWMFGDLVSMTTKPDDLAPLVIETMLQLEAAGDEVPVSCKNMRPKFSSLPPRMKFKSLVELLSDMAKNGLLEVVERKQLAGNRSTKVYAVTDAGRTLVQDNPKL